MSHRTLVYGAIIVGTLAISLDFASVNLALPALEAQYGLDLASVQWVINGYVLMWQLSGAALILAVSTAIFSAVSARDLQRSLAHDGIASSRSTSGDRRNHCRRQKRPCGSASDGGGKSRIWPGIVDCPV